jgi:hypothetical protein
MTLSYLSMYQHNYLLYYRYYFTDQFTLKHKYQEKHNLKKYNTVPFVTFTAFQDLKFYYSRNKVKKTH